MFFDMHMAVEWHMHWSSNHKEVDFEVLYIYDIFLLKAALALSVNCGMPELKSYVIILCRECCKKFIMETLCKEMLIMQYVCSKRLSPIN